MTKKNIRNQAGRTVRPATLVPKYGGGGGKRKREQSSVLPRDRRSRTRQAESVVPEMTPQPEQEEEVRRSGRQRRNVSYSEQPDLDAALNEGSGSILREETPLFAPAEEEEEIRVKEEPLDDEEEELATVHPGMMEPIQGAPHLPTRDPAEIQAMREGAMGSTHRTGLGTGLDDPQAEDEETTAGSPGTREDEGMEDMADMEVGEDGKEYKPVTRLSYTGRYELFFSCAGYDQDRYLSLLGFSISSRHLVLIVEPWPPLQNLPKSNSRSRSLYSRSMTRQTGRESTIDIDNEPSRGETPLVPNSRRGGTSVLDRPTATPGPGGYGRWSATPAGSYGRGTPGPSSRNAAATGSMGPPAMPSRLRSETPMARDGRSETPLFRDATPFGDDDDEAEDEDEEWKEKARASSWAPLRGGSEAPEGFGFRSGLDDDLPGGLMRMDEDVEEDVEEARGMMAMSQRIQDGSSARRGGLYASGGQGDDGDGNLGDEADEGVGDDVGGPE
jgi:hypothetical protein